MIEPQPEDAHECGGHQKRRAGDESNFEQAKRRTRNWHRLTWAWLYCCFYLSFSCCVAGAQQVASFPGVSRDLASFCSARPSLSIELAAMVVHVKKATSFNYKLYLFSSDNHVFQTGQIVPRDDFRIHSFPVKLKHFNDFLPADVATFQQTSSGSSVPVKSSSFNAKAFFAQVPVMREEKEPEEEETKTGEKQPAKVARPARQQARKRKQAPAFDVHDDILPGDASDTPFGHHDVALVPETSQAPNSNVQFDRDDQVSVLGGSHVQELDRPPGRLLVRHDRAHSRGHRRFAASVQQTIMPVAAFSSFHINSTYLVRKDFDQRRPELVRLLIDPAKFQVVQVDLLHDGAAANGTAANASQLDERAFLNHKLLSDPNTRITSISQIYEDWITRNFYTLVYIQRRLEAPEVESDRRARRQAEIAEASRISGDADELSAGAETEEFEPRRGGLDGAPHKQSSVVVNDRLVFRGSSSVLLGADQLDYEVKASAFITEKNALHYYLEFLAQGKFNVGAVDWTKRPFSIIDAQRFPLRQTRTKFDNEELLLCPPSVCYSDRPIDEVLAYGRLALSERLMQQAATLKRSLSAFKPNGNPTLATPLAPHNQTISEHDHELIYARPASDTLPAPLQLSRGPYHQDDHQLHSLGESVASKANEGTNKTGELIDLDELIAAVRTAAKKLEVRLHLRDWVWSLPRLPANNGAQPRPQSNKLGSGSLIDNNNSNDTHNWAPMSPAKATERLLSWSPPPSSAFAWHFEWARRNDIKVTPDAYGFVLTGHEIDASYRVYNELYLISANHLISINYTLDNETVTSAHPIGDEFQGLSSSLFDPITGAFYDRYANQVYFFKGDRYVGYDYASKKPLDDFLLPPVLDSLAFSTSSSMPRTTPSARDELQPGHWFAQPQEPLVSSLPVVGILGRQHHVDAVYHDFQDDLVHVFSGPKFYTFHASDFKDGAFRTVRQPALRCINEHFLQGCRFDEAFPNPCQASQSDEHEQRAPDGNVEMAGPKNQLATSNSTQERNRQKMSRLELDLGQGLKFSDEQQMKLRSIAARGGGLLDVLLESTLMSHGAATRAAVEPFLMRAGPGESDLSTQGSPQERIVVYLLVAMVVVTTLVTLAMIFVILSWSRVQTAAREASVDDANEDADFKESDSAETAGSVPPHSLRERVVYPPALSQYLNHHQYNDHHRLYHNQHHQPYEHQFRRQMSPAYDHEMRRHQALAPGSYVAAPQHHARQGRRSSNQPSLAPPPQSQLFHVLNQKANSAKSTAGSNHSSRVPTSRYGHDTIVDSSAL